MMCSTANTSYKNVMKHVEESIRNRRSVRTFDRRDICSEDIDKLKAFIETIENPYNIPVEFKFLNGKEKGLICPVISGTDLYVGGKIKQVPHANEAFGYSFEMLVLYAQSLGIGTVWPGGTMNRSEFEKAMELDEDEMMPCATPLGYQASKMSIKEKMMRKAIKANERIPFEELFFQDGFNTPLTEEKAGRLYHALEMVRLAPSAVNKQPWRIVLCDDAAHFYLSRSRELGSTSIDIQKVDMGIALCHFELATRKRNIEVTFSVNEPQIQTDKSIEYIASYVIKEKQTKSLV